MSTRGRRPSVGVGLGRGGAAALTGRRPSPGRTGACVCGAGWRRGFLRGWCSWRPRPLWTAGRRGAGWAAAATGGAVCCGRTERRGEEERRQWGGETGSEECGRESLDDPCVFVCFLSLIWTSSLLITIYPSIYQ